MTNEEFVDITPSPMILRVLGEIPFNFWQCIAELIDNSIDAFLKDPSASEKRSINITWSSNATPFNDKTIEISDNAAGMTKEQLQNAVRAGYSSNNPIDSLGLFGVGFNIATARLGYRTEVITTKAGDEKWTRLMIDFEEISKKQRFSAPITYLDKNDINEHGTRIIISKLRNDISNNQEASLKRQFANVYSSLINDKEIEIFVRGNVISPKRVCIWSKERYTIYKHERVNAYIPIDCNLGQTYFNVNLNKYCNHDDCYTYEFMEKNGQSLPEGIIKREKHLHGWVGIQRYADVDDFGIDFIRNGRKILISNKDLFSFTDELTGKRILQYPVDLGTTVGGRIVGEIHVDYLIPTYQKNDFIKDDDSWAETIYALVETGIILPSNRQSHGLDDDNESPIGLLANAYRDPRPGTKKLFVANKTARELYRHFLDRNPDYETDELWFKAAQEADQAKSSGGVTATPVNPGTEPSEPSKYIKPGPTIPGLGGVLVDPPKPATVDPPIITSTIDELMRNSARIESMSGKYGYGKPPFDVTTYELSKGEIMLNGKSVPCYFKKDGMECQFFYNPHHKALEKYPIDAKYLLLIYLAEQFSVRDSEEIVYIYSELMNNTMSDRLIDFQVVSERSARFFTELRNRLFVALKECKKEVVECIHESLGDVEDTCNNILSQNELTTEFLNKTEKAFGVIRFVPQSALIRIVDRFPD